MSPVAEPASAATDLVGSLSPRAAAREQLAGAGELVGYHAGLHAVLRSP